MKKSFILVLLTITLTISCAVLGSGNIIEEERVLAAPFTSIDVSVPVALRLVQGTENKIILEGDDNVLDVIETEIVGGELRIRVKDNKNINPTTLTAEVQFTGTLSAAHLNGSGSIKSDVRISSTTGFTADVTGSGSINLDIGGVATGTTVRATVSGSGSITLKNLNSVRLEGNTTGSGDIDYSGNPSEVVSSNTGSGRVRKI